MYRHVGCNSLTPRLSISSFVTYVDMLCSSMTPGGVSVTGWRMGNADSRSTPQARRAKYDMTSMNCRCAI